MNRSMTTDCVDVTRWQDRGRGTIKQTVRGSHVDITVRLSRFASRIWSTTVVFGSLAVIGLTLRVVELFLSGKAAQILEAATKVR